MFWGLNAILRHGGESMDFAGVDAAGMPAETPLAAPARRTPGRLQRSLSKIAFAAVASCLLALPGVAQAQLSQGCQDINNNVGVDAQTSGGTTLRKTHTWVNGSSPNEQSWVFGPFTAGEVISYSYTYAGGASAVLGISTDGLGTFTNAFHTEPGSGSGSGTFTVPSGFQPGFDNLYLGHSLVGSPLGVNSQAGSTVTFTSLSCAAAAPVLGVTMTHIGNGAQGQQLAYTITPSTSVLATTTATLTAAFTLPTGMTYVSASGAGWSCGGSGQTGSCTRTGSFGTGNGPPITLIAQFATNATTPLVPSVQLSGGGASNTATASDSTTVLQLPTVIGLSPTVGSTAGGTSVTITGANLTGATAVAFGANPASGFTVDSATQISATSPPGTAGVVNVRVTTGTGTSATAAANQFTYSAPPAAPAVVTPANASTIGTATPTYTGTSGAGLTINVIVDGTPIGTTTADASGNWSRAQPTSLAAGSHTVSATATNADGITGPASATNTFTYVLPPVASAFTAAAVPYNAGSAGATTFSVTAHVTNSPTSYAVGSATTAQGGSVSIDSAGLVSYTPPASFRGNDMFSFTATNAGGTSNSALVTVPVSNPVLVTSLTGSGTRGTALSGVQLSTTGGTGPYSCASAPATGALPAGTTLNTNCTITGTPTASGTFTFAASVTDSSTPSGYTQTSSSQSLVIAAPTLSISPAAGALPGATAGVSYSQTITTSGGTAPYSYAQTSALPPGLTLSSGGVLSGTPTAVGNHNFTLLVTDSSSAGSGGPYADFIAYSLTVAPPSIALSPTTLGNPTVGTPYSTSVSASGGNGSYTYSLSGSVPPGLSINSTSGAITGTPTSGGSFTFTVSAADTTTGAGAPYSGSRTYTVTVGAPTIAVSPTSLSAATVGTSYSASITASGGTAPYNFAVIVGALPPGLGLATNGTLSGTPTAGGTFNFTVTATDASGGAGPYSGSRSYTLTVNTPTIAVAPVTLPGATAGVTYSQSISASGGTAPYNYAVTAGALPTGLSLGTDGTVSGTPTAGGTFNFTVTATDGSTGTGPYSGSRAYSITVAAATITVAPTSLPNWSAGTPFNQTVTASGGNGTYSFAVTAGALPPGWTLSSAGVLSGTATESNSFNFTITATDQSTGAGAPYSGSRAYTVNIGSPAFTLTPPTLSATAEQAYTGNFVAGGGTAPYTYSRFAGTIPPGLTLATDGTLSGTPTATGTFNFTVLARDNTTGPGAPYGVASNYNFTVTAPSAPVAGDVSETVAYNSSANPIALVLSGGTATSVAVAAMPSHGAATVSGLTISYTPTAGYFGADSFTYTATNAGGTSAAATVTITVSPPAAPVVADVTGVAIPYESSGTAIDVSGSITGVHSSVAVATAPAHGTASVAGDVVTYVPAAGYFGADSFTYTATGPGGTSAPATITLTVATPAAPVAADRPGVAIGFDAGPTPIDLSSSITGVHTAVAIVTAPTRGSATVSGDIVTYTATAGAFGADSFTYTATGPGGTSAPATVSITIATPGAPVAAGVGGVAVPYASSGTAIDLSASITGVHTSVAVATAPAHGTASVAGDVVTYVPAAGYFGADSFTYTATGPGGTSAPATVSLTVGLPPAPTVAAVNGVAVPYASTGTAIDLSASITGVHTSLAVATAPAHGTTSVAGNVVTYVPAAGYFGDDSFTYTATGPGGTSTPATVTLTVGLPPAPTATGLSDVAVPYASTGTAIDLSASVAGVHTGIAIATAPTHGTATVAGYAVTYVPAAGYFGADSFTFTVTGPGGTSAPATVTLTVGLPPAPVAANLSGVAIPHNGAGTAIDLAASITGVHTSIAVVTAPAHGTATVAGNIVTYTPTTDYYGEDSFTYTATGPGGTSAAATVTLAVALPPPPVTHPADTSIPGATTSGGSSAEIDLSSLIDGNATGVEIATQPEHGTVELLVGGGAQSALATGRQSTRALGRVVAVYTPQPGFQGTDSFTFVAIGPGGTSAPATVTITVSGVAPVAQDKTVDAGDGETVTVELTAGATGGPFNAATIVSVTPADSATTDVVASGPDTARTYTLRITPAARFDGAIVIRYTLSNAFGASEPATVTVNVDARPDPTADPNVRAISDAQAESTRRFARSQIGNFMQRNETLHNGGGRAGAQMGVRLQALDASRAFVEPDRYGEQATRALNNRIRGMGGDGRPVDGIAAMRGMGTARAAPGAGAGAASDATGPARPAEDEGGTGERRIGSVALWTGGAIEIGTQDRITGRSKITATSSGLSGGADIKLADSLVLGIGGGYGLDRSDIDGGAAHVRATNSIVAAYGSFAPITGLFVDGLIATGDLDFRTRRVVAETGALAQGVRDGSMTFGALALGIDRSQDDLRWSAYGRAEWMTAQLGAYSETGAGRMSLRFDARDVQSLSGVLGTRFEFTQDAGFASVTPRVRAEWRHEFEDGGIQFLDYADIPGPSQFSLGTTGWQRDQFELSLGSTLKLPSAWVFDLEMALRGASGERSGTLRAKISKEF